MPMEFEYWINPIFDNISSGQKHSAADWLYACLIIERLLMRLRIVQYGFYDNADVWIMAIRLFLISATISKTFLPKNILRN